MQHRKTDLAYIFLSPSHSLVNSIPHTFSLSHTQGCVFTYNSSFKYPHCVETNADGGAKTYGGYSQSVVVDHTYVLKVPTNLDMAAATPLLCAGITVYSPMKAHGLTPDMKFGVIGLGGLGTYKAYDRFLFLLFSFDRGLIPFFF